jgi:S-adenosylmethionine:tRNA ribosyltransferase-isomerase
MLRPGKRAREGTRILLRNQEGSATSIEATVVEKNQEGHGRLVFRGVPDIRAKLDELGQVPLPPYIERSDASNTEEDRDRYQTVFAEKAGSVAAPTAGLHFTEALLGQLRRHGVQVCFVTLHVGLGTFAPIKSEELSGHTMHEENYEISKETARLINDAKAQGRRVMAVGTTTLRVLESVAAQTGGIINATTGRTRIFIFPPYYFRIVDALVTNFHLPRSSLLMLVSAFAAPGTVGGREMVLSTYAEAIRQKYRFYSYGDAMLIL